jgi:hypothetical protein
MRALLALILAAAIPYPVALQPAELIGSWRACQGLTMLELHRNFTYDRYFADQIDQGYWEIQRYNRLELFYIEHGKRRIADTYHILDFRKTVMQMGRVKGEKDTWEKTSYSRHLPRLIP